MSDRSAFETGLEIRREALGADYVDAGLAEADDFMMAFQRLTTEWCWGYPVGPVADRKAACDLFIGEVAAHFRS
jgi:hypothetical protein